MSSDSRVSLRWTVVAASALALLAVGAGTTYVVLRSTSPTRLESDGRAGRPVAGPSSENPRTEPPARQTGSALLPDVVVTLSNEAVERAGITVATVAAGTATDGLRAAGVVEPNAYKLVAVTPLISGRIARVTAELGQHVKRGQTIAQIFSPELAETQTRYVSARAELEAHERELARTEKLVEIGAASRQELERVHAGHTARRADVQSVASRLRLLGLSANAIEGLGPGKAVDATVSVPAPISGIVTERAANVGLNVDQATRLFTVVDLSSVWVVADVYEKDFGKVRIGTPASITTAAYPDLVLQGRVSYIDPQVSPETRTAKVRVEVPNARNQLRLGMYAEALFGGGGSGSTPMVPRSAVQNVADRTVVYLVDPKQPGRFVEREVRLGGTAGNHVSVLGGVQAGDVVVGEGSFYVRAERERLGLRQSGPPAAAPGRQPSPVSERPSRPDVQIAKVVVGDQGYEPAKVSLRAGAPARVTFTRTSDKTCGAELVFPSLNIKRALPLNQPVVVEFTPSRPGDIAFACGMGMLEGAVVVDGSAFSRF